MLLDAHIPIQKQILFLKRQFVCSCYYMLNIDKPSKHTHNFHIKPCKWFFLYSIWKPKKRNRCFRQNVSGSDVSSKLFSGKTFQATLISGNDVYFSGNDCFRQFKKIIKNIINICNCKLILCTKIRKV